MNRERPRPQEKSAHRSLCHGACVQEKSHLTAPSAIQSNPETARFAVEQLLCFMQPLSLALIGLAAAVTLWGFAYKLSLYHRHAAPLANASVAKLWIDPNGASVAAPSRLKAKSHLLSGSQAFPCPEPRFHRLSSTASILPLCERRVAFFHLLIPSRGPPPLRFRLA
jgi:hypothetical protein